MYRDPGLEQCVHHTAPRVESVNRARVPWCLPPQWRPLRTGSNAAWDCEPYAPPLTLHRKVNLPALIANRLLDTVRSSSTCPVPMPDHQGSVHAQMRILRVSRQPGVCVGATRRDF